MKTLAYLFIILVIFTMLSATFQWTNPIIELIKGFKYGDKFAHLILIGTLAYCVNYLLKFRIIKRFNQNLLVGTIAITIFITLEECSQIWISTRTFDLIDLSANYIGIGIATLIIVKRQSKV
jgi:VanZ family protein